MKITCESCQAKYTIADEKVAGKTVKIRCKKCGNAIVVHGGAEGVPAPTPSYDPAAQQGDNGDEAETKILPDTGASPAAVGVDQWTVNVAEGDERTMTTAQLATEYAKGALSDDTYVWKEGMADWLPIANVPELKQHMTAQSGARAAAPAAAAAISAVSAALPDAPPVAAAAQSAPLAPQAAAAAVPSGGAASPAARRVARGGGGVDVFNANVSSGADRVDPALAASPQDRLVGERNENSVLFSLSALTAAETSPKPATRKDDAALLGLSGGPLAPSPKNNGRAGLDDIMNLGGGGIAAPMLAPPPLLAPVVEALPPQPAVAAPAVAPAAGPMLIPDVPRKKSPIGMILGVVVGLGLIAGVGYFFLQKPDEPATQPAEQTEATTAAPAPSAVETATPAPVEAAAADTARPSEKQTPEPTPSAETASTPAAATAVKTTPAQPSPNTPVRPAEKPAEKPAEPPPVAAPPPEKPAPAPEAASGSGREFNRGAATSALGAAASSAKSCKRPDGPTGTGRVKVTFAPSGNVTSAQVQGPPFAGTSVGGCVAGLFRNARVPPFDGAPISVSKSFTIN